MMVVVGEEGGKQEEATSKEEDYGSRGGERGEMELRLSSLDIAGASPLCSNLHEAVAAQQLPWVFNSLGVARLELLELEGSWVPPGTPVAQWVPGSHGSSAKALVLVQVPPFSLMPVFQEQPLSNSKTAISSSSITTPSVLLRAVKFDSSLVLDDSSQQLTLQRLLSESSKLEPLGGKHVRYQPDTGLGGHDEAGHDEAGHDEPHPVVFVFTNQFLHAVFDSSGRLLLLEDREWRRPLVPPGQLGNRFRWERG